MVVDYLKHEAMKSSVNFCLLNSLLQKPSPTLRSIFPECLFNTDHVALFELHDSSQHNLVSKFQRSEGSSFTSSAYVRVVAAATVSVPTLNKHPFRFQSPSHAAHHFLVLRASCQRDVFFKRHTRPLLDVSHFRDPPFTLCLSCLVVRQNFFF